MQNLLLFLIRYGVFLTFVLLEAICFYLVVQFNQKQQGIYLYSSNVLSGHVMDYYNGTLEYMNLANVNDSLSNENAQLKLKISALNVSEDSLFIKDSLQAKFDLIAAKVINNSIDRRNNTLTLNKGRSDGIRRSQGVISDHGIVGIVGYVSEHFATVYSILHSNIKVSGKVSNSNYFGTLSWNGKDIRYLTLSAIPKHAQIRRGDTIQTTSYSTIFPPDIDIGIIEDYTLQEGKNDFEIKVRLLNSLANLSYVYVTNLEYIEERRQLEKIISDE